MAEAVYGLGTTLLATAVYISCLRNAERRLKSNARLLTHSLATFFFAVYMAAGSLIAAIIIAVFGPPDLPM